MSSAVEKSSHASASNPAIVAAAERPSGPTNVFSKFAEDYLVFPKLLYFGLNVVIYSTHSFLFQYVRDTWFITKSEFSLTNFVQFTNIAGSFVFSRLADRTGKYRLIVSGCVAAYTLCMCLLLFPVMLPTDHASIKEYTGKIAENIVDPLKAYRISLYLLINAACFFFTSGTFPLLDSMVMSKLSSNPNLSKELFGRQRLWGTIGHCIIGVIVHFIYDHTGKNLNVMFYTLIVTSILFIGAVFVGIPGDLKVEAHSHGHHGSSGNKDSKEGAAASPAAGPRPTAFSLMTSPSFSFFLGTVFVAGFIRSVITTFQSPYITDELFFDKSVVSGSIFVRVFPECALYFFSKEIIQWFGIYWVLVIGHTAGVVRMFGYTLINPGVAATPGAPLKDLVPNTFTLYSIFALECLKGVNSSLVISSAARIASDMAPKGLASTAQGLVAGTWQGLSMTLASLSGYFLVKYMHIKGTFLLSSCAGAVCIVLIVLKFAMIDRVLFASSRKPVA